MNDEYFGQFFKLGAQPAAKTCTCLLCFSALKTRAGTRTETGTWSETGTKTAVVTMLTMTI